MSNLANPLPDPPPSDSTRAFELLHPGVQRQLWRMKWQRLRPLQVEAIQEFFASDRPLLLSAATAAGKTEAAFLPILSRLAQEPGSSVRALYVGPLRALINDQFSRLEDLCEHLHLPVHRWHGDVGASAKRKLVDKPAGILLLTPESLESLFVNRSPQLERLFSDLEYVVIDELHVFLGTERGRQLQSLLHRLEQFSAQPARRFGLSATVGSVVPLEIFDKDEQPSAATGGPLANQWVARSFLNPEAPELVQWIEDAEQKDLKYRISCYLQPTQERDSLDELAVERQIAADISKHFAGKTSLIFANARGDVEAYADLCRPSLPNLVVVHHGSLARDIREETEEILKTSSKSRAVTAFCSSTLELGIDLGDVAAVGQIGPPPSVASLKQRLGRSGRGEEQSRVLRVYLPLEEPEPADDIFDRLHLPLIQTIAATELLLANWVEAPRGAACDLSTLTHQIISVVAQTGGIKAGDLYGTLCGSGAFSGVEPAVFGRLLRCLGDRENDVVEQTASADLILGLKGERLRQKRDFYAVFATPEEYALYHQGHLLGQLPIQWCPPPGEHLLFAGRRWQVVGVEEARKRIDVIAAAGKKRPSFHGEGSEVDLQLRRMMRQVLRGTAAYTYLDSAGTRLLEGARLEARRAELFQSNLLPLGPERTAVLLWCGDRQDASARLLLRASGVTVDMDHVSRGVAIICKHSTGETARLLERAVSLLVEEEELVKTVLEKRRRKYDSLLTDALLDIGLARDWLDLDGARKALSEAL